MNTKNINHAEMVKVLRKPAMELVQEFTEFKADIVHMSIGISGEAGELLDAVKKCVMYNKELDRVNVIEELGDIEFYLEGLRQILGITREETLEGNISKLGKRYESFKYSNQAAQDRADKN